MYKFHIYKNLQQLYNHNQEAYLYSYIFFPKKNLFDLIVSINPRTSPFILFLIISFAMFPVPHIRIFCFLSWLHIPHFVYFLHYQLC